MVSCYFSLIFNSLLAFSDARPAGGGLGRATRRVDEAGRNTGIFAIFSNQ
jgi:hypothetical protein